MNSTEIYQLLETIASCPKKTDKERLLREADCEELRNVLADAYNPTVNYYIKKVPSVVAGQANFCDSDHELLCALSTRRITGHEAQNALAQYLSTLNLESKELLTRIIKRDLRAGFSASTINKVFKGLIKEYPYMQYSLLSKVKPESYDWEAGVYAQIKMDGMYMSVDYYPDGEVVGLSRQGSEMPAEHFADIFNHVKTFFAPGYQYHGEVLVKFEGAILPRETANGLLNSVAKGGSLPEGHSLQYVVWDMVELDVINGEKDCHITYSIRYLNLSHTHFNDTISLVKTLRVHSLQDAFKVYAKALASGQEGIMLKCPSLMWKDHKTTKGCKLKLAVDVDLEITGFTEGRGKNASTFGAISMQTCDGLLKVDVSGMSDETRLYVHMNRDKLLGTIATVCANDVTKIEPASLSLPRLVEFRKDKTIADSLQQVIEQFDNAKQGV